MRATCAQGARWAAAPGRWWPRGCGGRDARDARDVCARGAMGCRAKAGRMSQLLVAWRDGRD
eukprot:6492784-Lingulodinium_polyedra.AAC.1